MPVEEAGTTSSLHRSLRVDDAPIPAGVDVLTELAFNLRSSWNHRADALWEAIDPEMWRATASPWLVLQSAPRSRLQELCSRQSFRESAESLIEARRSALSEATWFTLRDQGPRLGAVAFFSMEYAVSEALPLYSGGLGNVAGDYLKAASDLGVPLVGVGLLYQQGYFRQAIDASGRQREFLPFNDVTQLPLVPVTDAEGGRVRVPLPRAGLPVWLRAWEARVGRVALYLLDSNDPANIPTDRGITAQLYGGGPEVRLLQEMALGIGGMRLLSTLGIVPDVLHLNEGHSALAALEGARAFMQQNRCTFDVAVTATRVGNLFTTHTPIEAGFDRFSKAQIGTQLGTYLRQAGVGLETLMKLGRSRVEDPGEPLNMAWLATRLSGAVNAVSQRHGEVSRRIFQVLYNRWPEAEVPVGHVTNGIHVPSWDSAESDAFWTRASGSSPWRASTASLTEKICASSDADLWALRASARSHLVAFVRDHVARQLAASGVTGHALDAAAALLDHDTLTIGIARRFTDYKRPALLLRDPDRFARILRDARRPVQVVVAGKAHPEDERGKDLIQQWVRFVRRDDVRASAAFLADYDLRVAERLVQGVDVWLNTPRPPWEACGTSGMKALVNGGLNLSARDGWWAEAYRPEVGWVLEGDGTDDEADAERLYRLLEDEVVPAFYDRDSFGIPHDWVERMRASMARLTPQYSATRALRDYTERHYLPSAQSLSERTGDNAAIAREIAAWKAAMTDRWPSVRFGDVHTKTESGHHLFDTTLYLDGIDPTSVFVELYADGEDGGPPIRIPMTRGAPLVGAQGFSYRATAPLARAPRDFTPRAIPFHTGVRVPLELSLIAWAR